VSSGAKSPSTLTVALVLFGLAGSAVMVAVPTLFAGPVRPEFTVFLVAGMAAIVLTAGFFGYIYRLGMGFGRTVLVLAAGYNALIAAVKLGLAPAALYQANRSRRSMTCWEIRTTCGSTSGSARASSCSTCSSSG